MENNNSIQIKLNCLSVEESAVDQSKQEEMEASPQKHWLCNELIWELCKEIPIVKTSERILLTSQNMYAYLELRFSKMRLIYGDAIAFLKAKLNNAKESVHIWIDGMAHNNESEPNVEVNQERWDEKFKLKTNKFHVNIYSSSISYSPKVRCSIWVPVTDFEIAHLLYFLRLIAPLIHPIRLSLCSSIPNNAGMVRLLNKQSEWIDSIRLWDHQFNWEPIYRALKLQICGPLSPANVPKLIQWLTNNNKNSGQPKKYLFLNYNSPDLINKLKKEFARAKSKCRFVVRLELDEQLDEFTLRNKLTGERLQLRRKSIEDGWYIHTLSRFPNNGSDDNENDFAELDTLAIIYLH